MTTICEHQRALDNWRTYLDSLDKRINESAVYKFTGTPSDPDNPDSKWNPKSIKKTFIGRDPTEPIKALDKAEKESLLEKIKPVLIAAGIGAAIYGAWRLLKLTAIARWIGSLGSKIFNLIRGRGMGSLTTAVTGRGALVGLIRSGLSTLLGVTAGAAIITAVGYATWQVYKIVNPKAAEAVENKKGPNTQEYIDDIEKGKVSLNMRSWRKASDSATGRKLQCSWCRSNPGREFPTIRTKKGSWVRAKEVERPGFFETIFTSEKELNKKKTYGDATESGMPDEMEKLYYDIKQNGPFCKDILKRNDCINSTGPGNNDASVAVPGLQTQMASNSSLDGEVTEIKNVGIQHNLTGERKRAAELYVAAMVKLGITNKYVLAGALATAGKESGFVGKAEGARYGFERLRNKNAKGNKAVANRVRKVFMYQLGREPNDQEWRQLSSQNGLKGGIALFNIAYGYQPFKKPGLGKYTTYQEEKAIPHSIKVISSPGVINPDLFDPERAGYKYRGRGAIQITFKENYRRTAKRAGLDVDKIVEDPDLLVKDPNIGALMNASVTKGSYAKTSYNLTGRGMAGNPKTLLDGIKFMCLLAGGGGGNPNSSWFRYAVSKAVEQANKHIRISGES